MAAALALCGALARVQHDVEYHQFRLWFELGRRRQELCDEQFRSPRTLQSAIRIIVRVAFKVHLGHKSILLAINFEVNVRWPDCIGTDRIRGRFNSLEPISTFRVRG